MTFDLLITPPPDIFLSKVSKDVLEVITEHTSFPWAVLHTQARRLELDAAHLKDEDLPHLLPQLSAAIGRFSCPDDRIKLNAALSNLCDRAQTS